MQFEEFALRLNAGDFASRSKAKTKPQRRDSVSSYTRTILGKELGPMLNQENIQSPIVKCRRNWFVFFVMEVYPEKMMERLKSWRIKDNLQKHLSCIVIIGLTKSGRKAWQEEEETRRDISIVLIRFRNNLCTSELFKVMQNAVSLILLYRTMSLFRTVSSSTFIMSDVQSIYIPSTIRDSYREVNNLSNRQTVFFLPVDPMDKNRKDPDTIDLEAPRLAQYMHKAWKKHQNTVYWVDINLALKKGLKFYQTRSNAIILHETLPAYCIPKVVRMETGEVINEKVYASPRLPPKISLKHDWMKELGSEVARQPEGEVVQQSKSSQSSQPNQNPDHDRTVKPVVCP